MICRHSLLGISRSAIHWRSPTITPFRFHQNRFFSASGSSFPPSSSPDPGSMEPETPLPTVSSSDVSPTPVDTFPPASQHPSSTGSTNSDVQSSGSRKTTERLKGFETFRIEEHLDDSKKYVYFVHSNHRIDEKKVVEARMRKGHSEWAYLALSYVKSALLPKGYPHTVSSDYKRWHFWQACQQVCSAFNGVMSTHALLTALGMGSSAGAAGTGAVAQWVLKDGLGNLGKILFGWKYGSILDSDSKKWRFRADLFFNVGVALEISTLFAPSLFLPLAVTANLAKGVAAVAGGATRASIVKSFLHGENMADVAAKAESQVVIASLCGMLMGIAALPIVSHSSFAVVQAVAISTSCHIVFNYMAVRQVYLPTLNRFRTMALMHGFLNERVVPSREEVAGLEKIMFPNEELRPVLIVGQQFRHAFAGKQDAVNPVFDLFRNDSYLLTLNRQNLHIIYRKDATSEAILRGFFHATCVQYVLNKIGGRSSYVMLRNVVLDLEEELKLLRYTQDMCHEQFPSLIKGMREKGWNINQLLIDLGPTRLDWHASSVSIHDPQS